MSWQLSDDLRSWLHVNSISAIYVNEWFVWIVIGMNNAHKKGIIIGRDSLSAERFIQLRRCILSPDVLHRMSS